MSTPFSLETKSRYAVCVGINRYLTLDQVTSLECAEQDAKDVHALLLQHGFEKENCRLLIGSEATREAIQNALITYILSKPRHNDLVVLYFAGHGVPININDEEEESELQSDIFLCSFDFELQKIMNERGEWLNYPLRMEKLRTEFFEQTRSKKVLFILDSCHSGDFFGAKYRIRDGDILVHRYIEQPFGRNSTGRVVLSSCLPHQVSREDSQLGHGIFTYHLLEALAGRVQRAIRDDGWITVGSLFEHLADTLPKNQRPVRSGVEHDTFRLLYYPVEVEQAGRISSLTQKIPEQQRQDKERRLKALLDARQS